MPLQISQCVSNWSQNGWKNSHVCHTWLSLNVSYHNVLKNHLKKINKNYIKRKQKQKTKLNHQNPKGVSKPAMVRPSPLFHIFPFLFCFLKFLREFGEVKCTHDYFSVYFDTNC
jgi:hypothetical protein